MDFEKLTPAPWQCLDLRACFLVSNDFPSVQNENTMLVMRLLGIEIYSNKVLAEESDDTCPNCGYHL